MSKMSSEGGRGIERDGDGVTLEKVRRNGREGEREGKRGSERE